MKTSLTFPVQKIDEAVAGNVNKKYLFLIFAETVEPKLHLAVPFSCKMIRICDPATSLVTSKHQLQQLSFSYC